MAPYSETITLTEEEVEDGILYTLLDRHTSFTDLRDRIKPCGCCAEDYADAEFWHWQVPDWMKDDDYDGPALRESDRHGEDFTYYCIVRMTKGQLAKNEGRHHDAMRHFALGDKMFHMLACDTRDRRQKESYHQASDYCHKQVQEYIVKGIPGD